jgi:hypothetical protein
LNWFRANNEFPVPVLTAIGELDGGGISYLRREWEETQALAEDKRQFAKTILVPQVPGESEFTVSWSQRCSIM